MNLDETINLLEMLKTLDPQTSINVKTGEAWHAVLGRYPTKQVVHAAMSIAERRRVQSGNRDTSALDPFDIKVEVRRIRQEFLDRVDLPCPNVDPSEAIEYAAELLALKSAAMDGRMSPADAERYAAGGLRITAGEPYRAAGETLNHRFEMRALVRGTADA